MLFDWLNKNRLQTQSSARKLISKNSGNNESLFNYSWIITGRLAIGPMPRQLEDWKLLENNGILKRFSCCYPEEHIFAPIPEMWTSKEVSLPDHRLQEELTSQRLIFAIEEAINLIKEDDNPIYLHCFAGQERSALLATGIVSLLEDKDLFESLAWVRQCYTKAKPLYEHLDLLETTLKEYK